MCVSHFCGKLYVLIHVCLARIFIPTIKSKSTAISVTCPFSAVVTVIQKYNIYRIATLKRARTSYSDWH